jgi:hypothetical protein
MAGARVQSASTTSREAQEAPRSAVFVLKSKGGSPQDTQELADSALRRAGARTGETSGRVKIFKNVRSMAVEASPRFLEALAQDEAVASSRANETKEDLLIRPVSSRKVRIDRAGPELVETQQTPRSAATAKRKAAKAKRHERKRRKPAP